MMEESPRVSVGRDYKKNYLTAVILKIDFPTIQDFNTTKLKELQKEIRSDFPILQERKAPVFNLNLDQSQKFEAKTGEILTWILSDRDSTRNVSIEENNLTLEFGEYSSFQDFFSKIKLVLDTLFKIFPDIISTRVGLRYVNQIKINEEDPFDLSKYINENLIKSLDFFGTNPPLSRYICSTEIKELDFNMIFKFGISNSLYPSKIIKKEFVLDYDCFTLDTLEKEDILRSIEKFHKKIKEFFEKSIKNDLRTIMER